MDSAMYFRACAMVRSGHQDLLIAEMRVPSKRGGAGGGGVSARVVGEEGGGEGCKNCNSVLEKNEGVLAMTTATATATRTPKKQ